MEPSNGKAAAESRSHNSPVYAITSSPVVNWNRQKDLGFRMKDNLNGHIRQLPRFQFRRKFQQFVTDPAVSDIQVAASGLDVIAENILTTGNTRGQQLGNMGKATPWVSGVSENRLSLPSAITAFPAQLASHFNTYRGAPQISMKSPMVVTIVKLWSSQILCLLPSLE